MDKHKPKISNLSLGILSIFAIFLIVFMALNFAPTSSTTYNVDQAYDRSGYATQAVLQETDLPLCKIVVGLSTVYDSNVLAITLEEGASTTYSGKTISVGQINADGCVIGVSDESDYLAKGQIQRLGYLYVTVIDVVN